MNTVNEWTWSDNGTMAALEAERNWLALQHEQDVRTINELRDAMLMAAEELKRILANFNRLLAKAEAQIDGG